MTGGIFVGWELMNNMKAWEFVNFIFSRCSILRKGLRWLKHGGQEIWFLLSCWKTWKCKRLNIKQTGNLFQESGNEIPRLTEGCRWREKKIHLGYFSKESWKDLVSPWMWGGRQASWTELCLRIERGAVWENPWWAQTRRRKVSRRWWHPQTFTSVLSNVDMVFNGNIFMLAATSVMQPYGRTSHTALQAGTRTGASRPQGCGGWDVAWQRLQLMGARGPFLTCTEVSYEPVRALAIILKSERERERDGVVPGEMHEFDFN